MPRFDRTGPNGDGPMTGRRMGNCIDENTCQNGTRKRCCQKVDSNFCQNRMRRNNTNKGE